MSKNIEQILKHRFCERDGFRENLSHIHNDGENIVATNGHILARLDVTEGLEGVGDGRVEGYPNWKGIMPADDQITESFQATTDQLRSSVNDKEDEWMECPECEGKGGKEHWCDCDYCDEDWETCQECDGSGQIKQGRWSKSLIEINGVRYHSRYINDVVTLIEALDGTVVTLKSRSPNASLRFDFDGGTALVMPIMMDQEIDYTESHNYEIVKTLELEAV